MKALTSILLVLIMHIYANASDTVQSTTFTELKGSFNEEISCWISQDDAYDDASFSRGSEYATISRKGLEGEDLGMGLINIKGELVIPAKYKSMQVGFNEHGFCQVGKDQKYGLYHKSGELILKVEYDMIMANSRDSAVELGFIQVVNNNLSGLVNLKGEIVIPLKYPALGYPSKNLIPYMLKPAEWGYLNFEGEVILKPQFSSTWIIETGEACAQKDGINYIIREDGTLEELNPKP
ncbi:MAG: WG repeat-containing protein [Bacteroidota bacterium]